MPFADAAAKAIEAAETDENQTQTTETADTGDTSGQEELTEKADAQDKEAQAKASNQAILDLAKVEKFVVEGQEMTFDELKKAMLRQQDYTKKTQALAEERKFIDNLDADLEAVKQNPALAAKFKQIYPERFHRYLGYVTQGQTSEMSKTEKAQAQASLPPEVLEKLEQYEQRFQALDQEKMAAQQEQLTSFWDGLEQPAVKKYPYADLVHVYGMLENYISENGLTAPQILAKRDVSSQLFEHFAKASHEAFLRRADEYTKSKLEKTRKVNQEAGDIGKGGGTPTAAPARVKMRDVADMMIQDLSNQ